MNHVEGLKILILIIKILKLCTPGLYTSVSCLGVRKVDFLLFYPKDDHCIATGIHLCTSGAAPEHPHVLSRWCRDSDISRGLHVIDLDPSEFCGASMGPSRGLCGVCWSQMDLITTIIVFVRFCLGAKWCTSLYSTNCTTNQDAYKSLSLLSRWHLTMSRWFPDSDCTLLHSKRLTVDSHHSCKGQCCGSSWWRPLARKFLHLSLGTFTAWQGSCQHQSL